MKILQVCHFYPPEGFAGIEVYTRTLSNELQQRGHDVRVVCATGWTRGQEHFNGIVEDSVDGIPVLRLALNWMRAPRPVDYLYRNPVVAREFQRLIEAWRPDVMHVQSCYSLSGVVIEVARALGIPVVLHLHDFWFICPRHTLLRWDGTLCSGVVTPRDCQRCMLGDAKVYRYPRRVLSEDATLGVIEAIARIGAPTQWRGLRGMVGDYERRQAYLSEILAQCDMIVAPSQFMALKHDLSGVHAGSIKVVHLGSNLPLQLRHSPLPLHPLKIGYTGNISPIKGVHILIEAFQKLTPESAELHIHGPLHQQAYVTQLRTEAAKNSKISFHGPYEHHNATNILASLDVLVVPSLWYENSPFVIREAFALGVPVIVSGHGALPEMVHHNVDGLHFKAGDADDLAAQLRRLLDEPALLGQLRAGIRPLKPFADEVDELVTIYEGLLQPTLSAHVAA